MKNILIAGGSGFIGKQLTVKLQGKGYNVAWLTRAKNKSINVTQYDWDWKKKIIEPGAIESADVIVNLSGANINGKRWNEKWKKEIYDSRIKSTEFLYEIISSRPNKIKSFVSSSATGYYGCVTSEKIFTETDLPGTDFLGKTCSDWETSVNKFSELGIRTAIIRTGIVFSEGSEAFRKICLPVRFGVGAAIGKGTQYFSWIHSEDLCNIYLKAISDESIHGIYNAVAPEYITNANLIKTLAKHFNKPLLVPNIPAFAIKIMFGEIADSLLKGSRISSEKIMNTGFNFTHPSLSFIQK